MVVGVSGTSVDARLWGTMGVVREACLDRSCGAVSWALTNVRGAGGIGLRTAARLTLKRVRDSKASKRLVEAWGRVGREQKEPVRVRDCM